MSLYTPGPWRVPVFINADAPMRMGDCLLGQQICGAVRIGFTERQNVGAEEELANARLIAAAPDLLDVLKRLSSFEFHHQGIAEGPLATILQQAKTAIAKAEDRA